MDGPASDRAIPPLNRKPQHVQHDVESNDNFVKSTNPECAFWTLV